MAGANTPDLSSSLNNAFSSMSATDRATYLQGNAATLQDKMESNFNDSFGTSYKSSTDAARNFDILSDYSIQSNNLNTVVGDLANQTTSNINTANNNSDTAARTREIKEWYYNNKLDTLFVFQLIFISLCILAVLAYLSKIDIISMAVLGMSVGALLVIIILLISNRAVYTDMVRDKRYWSKRKYGVVGSALPGGLNPKCS